MGIWRASPDLLRWRCRFIQLRVCGYDSLRITRQEDDGSIERFGLRTTSLEAKAAVFHLHNHSDSISIRFHKALNHVSCRIKETRCGSWGGVYAALGGSCDAGTW